MKFCQICIGFSLVRGKQREKKEKNSQWYKNKDKSKNTISQNDMRKRKWRKKTGYFYGSVFFGGIVQLDKSQSFLLYYRSKNTLIRYFRGERRNYLYEKDK